MELRFNATEIGCTEDEGALLCGASNSMDDAAPYHYIIISGCSDPDDGDDDGTYFEIDDQINGNYNLLTSCTVSSGEITIGLLHGVPWHPDLNRVVIGCESATREQFDGLVAGLRRLFRPEDFRIESQ